MKTLTAKDVVQKFAAGEPLNLIDVRELDEVKARFHQPFIFRLD